MSNRKGALMGNGSITYRVDDITEVGWEDMFHDPDSAPDVNTFTTSGCSSDCGFAAGFCGKSDDWQRASR